MLYVDTSVLVALYLPEIKSTDVTHWYAESSDELVSSIWCITEFASALSIKQRTRQIDDASLRLAWQQFERFCANDLKLLPIDHQTYHRAAIFALESSSNLRSGDALHLAAALDAKVKGMVTLDAILAKNAQSKGLRVIDFS
jgi:uncharacterized protein